MPRQNSAPILGSPRDYPHLKRRASVNKLSWWKRVLRTRHHSQPIDLKKTKIREMGSIMGLTPTDRIQFTMERGEKGQAEKPVDHIVDKQTEVFDLAMTCLCFSCPKCLSAIQNAFSIPLNDDDIPQFETIYTPSSTLIK